VVSGVTHPGWAVQDPHVQYHHLRSRASDCSGRHGVPIVLAALCLRMVYAHSQVLFWCGVWCEPGVVPFTTCFGMPWQRILRRSAYVSWLQSQYWSRLTSCLPKKEAKTLFGPILGATSLFATVRVHVSIVLA